MQETSVIQLEGESKVALVFGQMNEPPGARARVALTGRRCPFSLVSSQLLPTTMNISNNLSKLRSRSTSGTKRVRMCLLFIDNIFRFTQAGSEVSALLGRIPSAVGYQPTLAVDMGADAGTYHNHPEGIHHLRAGRLRAR